MIIHPQHPGRTELAVLFKIISRHSWDNLQSWRAACPGSTVEHLYAGLYVLIVPEAGAAELEETA